MAYSVFLFSSQFPAGFGLNRSSNAGYLEQPKEYPWQDVSLKKASGGYVLILIRDSGWLIPRWVVLDGSSKQYKELVSRIKEIKQLSEIERL
jgi:hypothetical protein